MSSADTEAPDEAIETDERREAQLAEITELVGDAVVESHIDPGHELYLRIAVDQWKSVHRRLRDDLGYKFFEFLSVIDWMPSPYGKSEDATADAGVSVTTIDDPGEMEQGYAGGDSRFQLFTRLVDIFAGSQGVVIKADITDPRDTDEPQAQSLIEVFPGANWHEREAFEMFGVRFTGHPYLQHLYLPGAFEGNPLRKDYPLLARQVKPWPGIVDVEPMPEDDDSTDDDSTDDGAEGGDES
ncbi:MAG: NADH-quinone oxidoreductase subunit C [Acidimicrobiales bacterium]|nr:NADH-quinone oxidoreductase subunit C [Acidimicrobiales bacterium]